ncbi:hypothetical protein [Natronolimnobius baerhuensis]|uniref:STAS/SEC14 domain-containing protein n=1 Tax=Natronolimnobius baerhuensis TaxID=253108 RepID=A0A202E6Y2_9EURY|nr:hypothetical protein [Natronolimnobius baerhuensis]OVE83700.1 hypothetical protein B2G88_14835 [Natronolimnobius baerhuensis]
MQSNTFADPAEYEWDFEKRGRVGIWDMTGWQGFADGDLEAASDHYRERGKRADIDATLAVFGETTQLPKETQEFMREAWSANIAYAGVEKAGFVAPGITALAVKSTIEGDDADVESFTDLETALEWAQS